MKKMTVELPRFRRRLRPRDGGLSRLCQLDKVGVTLQERGQ